jgi:adenine C2-methylase RlmN of 23S rRNA A2503 and tRNA A37
MVASLPEVQRHSRNEAGRENLKILKSKLDASVNFVEENGNGFHESRFVRRIPDYFICYLSSHNGCNKACRFCHLTATGQTDMVEATIDEMVAQARPVFDHYESDAPARFVNFNFMARGEPLSSSVIRTQWSSLHASLSALATPHRLSAQFNVSTIMPDEMAATSLLEVFGDTPDVTPYYSLYSMSRAFRKRWLPKALAPERSLDMLKEWQDATGREVVLHWAFIRDQNDDDDTISDIIEAVTSRDLRVRFNLVRYNAYSGKQGTESADEVLERNFTRLRTAFGNQLSQMVPRVGMDVKASCGMFVS